MTATEKRSAARAAYAARSGAQWSDRRTARRAASHDRRRSEPYRPRWTSPMAGTEETLQTRKSASRRPCSNAWGAKRRGRRSGRVGNELHRIAEGLDRLGCIVRDLDPELFLESHHEFHGVEAIGTEIIDERGIRRHLAFLHPKMLD